MKLKIGDKLTTRGGVKVEITRITSTRIFGAAYSGRVKLEWWLDGQRVRRNGSDPFDLVMEQ